MKMHVLSFVLFCLLVFSRCSVMQYADLESFPGRAIGDFEFSVDFSIFQESHDTLRVVLYLTFPNNALTFDKRDKGFIAFYDGVIIVNTLEGKRVTSEEFEGKMEASSYEAAHSPWYFENREFSFELLPGEYSISVTIQDRDSQRLGAIQRILNLTAFPRNRVSLSSIVFAERIDRDAFEKVTIVPNPERIYNDRLPELSFYYEVYVPDDFQSKDMYKTEYEIVAQKSGSNLHLEDGPPVPSMQWKAAFSDVISLRGIQEGDLFLRIRILNSEGTVLAKRKGFFQIHWPLLNWGDDFELSLAQLELVASAEVVAEYNKVPPEGREAFLRDYWKSRDPVPQTEQNELLIEFERRLRHVKRHLGGIWTDKGRIYVQNGPPQDREKRIVRDMFGYARHAEVWIYYDPYREFVFIDDRLVHR